MPIDPNLPFSRFGTAPESPPDDRDHLVTAYVRNIIRASALPDEVGIENVEAHKGFVGITDQMQEGSCTGHAARNTKTTLEVRQRRTRTAKRRVPHHGPRGIYVLAKQMGGYPEEEGAYMRDVCRAMKHSGVPREKDWPYVAHTDNQGRSTDIGKPRARWLTNAKAWQIGSYAKVRTLDQMLTALHTVGPLFIAMTLHENFLSPSPDGVVPVPSGEEMGGHAMCILAATQSTKSFFVANSWGESWGLAGYCWIGFDHFLAKSASEVWVIPDFVEG